MCVCHGLLWVKENHERGKDTRHRWKDKIMCWHHLQRIVDVGKVRTLIWCRRCADWASEGRLSKRLRSRLSCQPRRLEQGYWLVKNGKLQERECLRTREASADHPRGNFRVTVTCTTKAPSWLSVGDGIKWKICGWRSKMEVRISLMK